VIAARRRQLQRDGILNSRLEGRRLRGRVRLDGPSRTLLEQAVNRLTLSARAFDRVLRVGRTIADLAESAVVAVEHLAEALQFRGSR
jgi:magnesium chelatase family protein